jgi:hypothetical protein
MEEVLRCKEDTRASRTTLELQGHGQRGWQGRAWNTGSRPGRVGSEAQRWTHWRTLVASGSGKNWL